MSVSSSTNVKLVNNFDEITKILQKFIKFKTKIEVIQDDDGDELVVEAEVKNLNIETKEIYLRPLNDDGFNMSGPVKIIFSNDFGNIEFEAKAGDFLKKTIAKFHFPSSIRIENLRSSQRMYLEEKLLVADIAIENNGNEQIAVIDISNSGIGLKCEQGKDMLKSGNNITIEKVGKYEFSPGLEAKVVYTKLAQTEDGDDFIKIGVQFNEPIENIEEVIESL